MHSNVGPAGRPARYARKRADGAAARDAPSYRTTQEVDAHGEHLAGDKSICPAGESIPEACPVVIDVDGRGIRASTRRGQGQHREQIAFRSCTTLAEQGATSFLRHSEPISCSCAPWSCPLQPMFAAQAPRGRLPVMRWYRGQRKSLAVPSTLGKGRSQRIGGAIRTTGAPGASDRIRADQTMRDASSSLGIRPCGVS